MPTIANSRLPKPSSWDEFEDICLSSFKLRWNSPNLSRHGRQGQEQQGVDIYGADNLQRLVGVQCKNTIKTISTNLIDEEILNAEKFTPALASLYIATTAESDANLQRHVRTISESRYREGKFTVDIVFWDAIEHDLSRDQQEIAKHYPQFFGSQVIVNRNDLYRERDIVSVNRLLNLIDIEATSSFLEYAPKYVSFSFMEHIEYFSNHIHSTLFHIYDDELRKNLFNWLNKWIELGELIRNAPYNYHNEKLSFYMPGDFCQSREDNEKYDLIEATVVDFFKVQNIFCSYIRDNYYEIDMVSTSLTARRRHNRI